MDRINQLRNHLEAAPDAIAIDHRRDAGAPLLSIGGVSVRVGCPERAELVPYGARLNFIDQEQEFLRHLRWIMQKDALGQGTHGHLIAGGKLTVCFSPPGSIKRDLIRKYAELANREIEYVPLSKDMTDGDLKQRREIRSATAYYTDQACVRAAIHGRILVLDGIEKAERNVLPIINNLLENREMALEDGRFLVHPKRFDSLLEVNSQDELKTSNLVRTSENFVVVALGLPVPKYDGYSLDPPLRSRFQSRNISVPTYLTQLTVLQRSYPRVPLQTLESLVSVGTVLRAEATTANGSVSIPEFPLSLDFVVKVLNFLPDVNIQSLLDCIYPYPLMNSFLEHEERSIVEAVYQRFGFGHSLIVKGIKPQTGNLKWELNSGYRISSIESSPDSQKILARLECHPGKGASVSATVTRGILNSSEPEFFVRTDYHSNLLVSLMLAHSANDFCIIGEKGVGKSALLRAFVKLFGYRVEYIPLYKDMSARDLLQRRSTNLKGDTVWENSALVKAAIEGSIAVLDQIEVAADGVIASIQSLVMDREITLPSGALLASPWHYDRLLRSLSESELIFRNIYRVHDSFRIVALARPLSQSVGTKSKWLTPELLSLFVFVPMRSLSFDEEKEVIQGICPDINEDVLQKLLNFAKLLRSQHDDALRSVSNSLSTRQLIRCVRRLGLYPDDSLYEIILKSLLSQFLPSLTKAALERLLQDSQIVNQAVDSSTEVQCEVVKDGEIEKLRIGNVSHPVSINSNKLLIPNIIYFENPTQTVIMREMLKDYVLGEHLLLIGNQGVGKNKLVDRLLQLLRLPREYIQLHRDTTIHNLTSIPSIDKGVIVYEDSALVKAARLGYILVVDEADKAPTHVTSVLKSLVEDGEMVLSDGRRLVYRQPDIHDDNIIIVHKNFRMFVLANRPGFPFLGNDFYAEIGDVFAAHCVGYPDKASELRMLKNYAPSVPEDILVKLIDSFDNLRHLVDDGLINYPYSTRELVSVVKHLEKYPEEGLGRALGNVFDFDAYDSDVKELIITTLANHGVQMGLQSDFKVDLGVVLQLPEPELLETWDISKKSKMEGVVERIRHQLLRESFKRLNSLLKIRQTHALTHPPARSNNFTEQTYAFKIPCHGEVLDACKATGAIDDIDFFLLTTNPICLYAVDSSHTSAKLMDLYEFYPLQTSISGLKILELSPGIICIHNSDECSLLVVNIKVGKLFSMNLDFALKGKSSHVFRIREGTLGFFQSGVNQLILVDFVKGSNFSIALPYNIATCHSVSSNGDLTFLLQTVAPMTNLICNYLLSVNETSWFLKHLMVKPFQENRVRLIDGIETETFDRFDYPFSSRPVFVHDDYSHGSFIKGLSEGLNEGVGIELRRWTRIDSVFPESAAKGLRHSKTFLKRSKKMVTIIPLADGKNQGIMEILDPHMNIVRSVKIPLSIPSNASEQLSSNTKSLVVYLMELDNGNILTVDLIGMARVWQTESNEISTELHEWKRLVGSLEHSELSIKFILDDSDEKESLPMVGEGQGSGIGQGEGSGQGFGGGGQGSATDSNSSLDQSGSGVGGGMGGEPSPDGRQDQNIDLSKFSLRTANDVPKAVTDAQRQIHEMAMKKRLDQLKMSEKEMKSFSSYRQNISREIQELRAIVQSTEAKRKERVWLRNQTSGDVDDTKLVEGITGERAVYKRRGEDDSVFQQKPKKLFISFDLSASMARFNGLDSRLERSLECALLVMEAFKGFEHKFQYKITGHSGDGPNFEFVNQKYPKNEKEMFDVLNKMSSHARFCLSGDNTVTAVKSTIQELSQEDADDHFALILSDANLSQYNIQPDELAAALTENENINAYIIFIGSIKDQAEILAKSIPQNAFVCLDTKQLPKILKTIFVNSML
ncbi:von Willebrand factor A domain-containing protein 8, partial [Entophlyctis sp. JEL0112]